MEDIEKRYFGTLRLIFEEILSIKTSSENEELASERRTLALLLFVLIKKVSRMVKYKIRLGREDLQLGKIGMESNRLQLQNLFYEVNHLNREINNCHQFRSQDEDIDIFSEEEYFGIVHTQDIPLTDHERRVCRLEWELNYRKQLSSQSIGLLNSKKKIFQDIVKKMEQINSLTPSLRSLLDATQPLQVALQIIPCSKWKFGHLVKLLPQSLYLIYMNIHALKNTFGLQFNVSIVDIGKDGQKIELESQIQYSKNDDNSLTMNTSEEENTRSSVATQICKTEQRSQNLRPHRLVVKIKMDSKNSSSCIIYIHAFHKLGFVTASAVMQSGDIDENTSESLLSDDILKSLFPNDSGENIPTVNIEYQLQKYGISIEDCMAYINANNFGKPFRWLQRMCGIETFNDNEENSTIELQKNILEVIKKIEIAWESRINLFNQIKALENKNFELHLRNEKLPLTKPSCSFLQWTPITWEEYSCKIFTREYIAIELVKFKDIFYRAVIVRGSAKMECLISISSSFPDVSPIWALCIYWNGEHNSSNNSAVKMMEYFTNTVSQDELHNRSALLCYQLVRTMFGFDIFLETESPYYMPLEYNKEKQFVKAFAKRTRARPYKYIKKGNVNVFK